jgi:NitT/TauT family transport system substrate-binding protein
MRITWVVGLNRLTLYNPGIFNVYLFRSYPVIRRFIFSLAALLPLSVAAEPPAGMLKIGVLAFGTVNWELESIRNEGLDKKYGLDLDVQKLAGPDAGKIGLQAGGLDMIATDWIWVANQNQIQNGAEFRFIPYSLQAGALMAPAGSAIHSVADLKGKKLGVAGGPLDKNWILLKAYAKKEAGLDLEKDAEPVFAAPPLLNQQLADGKLDALLNFWHYAAKLEAQGFRRVLDGREVLKGLGVAEPLPNLGLVFKQSWAAGHGPALDAFLKASAEARGLLCGKEEAAWNKIAPSTGESDPVLQAAMRKEYCAGLVKQWTDAEREGIAKIYTVLHQTGGVALTGEAEALPDNVFWAYKIP